MRKINFTRGNVWQAGHFGPSTTVTYKSRTGQEVTLIIGAGSRDRVHVFRSGDSISVEWSKHTVISDGSGPCGDLDTPGDSVVAYNLPPDAYPEKCTHETKREIRVWQDDTTGDTATICDACGERV